MKTATLHRVRVPVERSVPLEQLNPGAVLARPVRSDKTGQTLLTRGTVLNRRQIEKARKFHIKRVMIQDEVRRWVTGTLIDELYQEADFLETHEWSPNRINGEHPPRVLELFEEHDGQNCGYFQLWLMTQKLQDTIDQSEAKPQKQKMDDIQSELETLREEREQTRSRIQKLPDPTLRTELRRVMEGLIDPLPSYLRSLECPDGIRLSIQHYVERRDRIQSRLWDVWEQEQARDQKKLPPAETEPPSIPEPSDMIDWMRRGLSLAESGRWNRSLTHFIVGTKHEGGNLLSLHDSLVDVRDRWLELNERYNQLAERIAVELGSEEDRIVASELLQGSHEIALKQVVELTCSESLFDSLEHYINGRTRLIHRAWTLIQRVVFRLWRQVPDEQRIDIRKKLTVDHESVPLQSSTQPWLYPDYHDIDPWSQTPDEINRMIREQDAYGLAQNSGISESIARSILHLYTVPDSPEKWPAELIRNWNELLGPLLFGSYLDMDQVQYVLQKMMRMITKLNRPLHLILTPPSPEQHLLVHSYNQCVVSLLIAVELGLPRFCLTQLLLASALGDSGMSQLPDSLILGDRELSERGWEEVKNHPHFSRQWAVRIIGPGQVIPRLVSEHHERVNGSGYPGGIESDEQHPLSSILACADVYTALLEPRPHRPARTPDQALETLVRSRKRHSRPVLWTLIDTMGFYPNGCQVRLSDERVALVKDQVEQHPRQPRVLIVTDPEGKRVKQGETLMLSRHPDLHVQEIVKV